MGLGMLQVRQPVKPVAVVLSAALLIGWLHELLFYDKDWGVSYPLFVLLFYLYFYWAVREKNEFHWGSELLFLIPTALLSLTYAVFSNVLFMVLNALAVPCLILVHTTWTIRRKELRWFDPALAEAVLEQVFIHSLRYVPLPIQTLMRVFTARMKSGRSRQLWKVMIGLLISLPILLLVGSLLSSADAVFESAVSRLPQWLGKIELGPVLFRVLWVAAVGTGLFVYVWGLLYPKLRPSIHASMNWRENEADFERRFGAGAAERKAKATGKNNEEIEDGRIGPPTPVSVPSAIPSGTVSTGQNPALQTAAWGTSRLDPTIMTTVLLMLNAVYVLFAAVQFSYFFGGVDGLLPPGVTYAEYARRGFAELVAVTVINFTVLMITMYGVDRPRKEAAASLTSAGPSAAVSSQAPDASAALPERKVYRVLTVLLALLIGCTGVMLASAYLRLSLYEMAYGFTMARVLVHAFMMYLLVLFIAALFKLYNDRLPLMKLYLIVSIGSYALLNYVRLDAVIAANNIDHYEKTGQVDTAYLQSLSFEAVPSLLRLRNSHPEAEGAQRALEIMKQRLKHRGQRSWTEFNLSEWRARRLLQEVPLTEEMPLRP